MKTAELEGALLDYWVERAAGPAPTIVFGGACGTNGSSRYSPSTNWAQGGPLIEREMLEIRNEVWGGFNAMGNGCYGDGPSILIAAMRCIVASKYGEEVPDIKE